MWVAEQEIGSFFEQLIYNALQFVYGKSEECTENSALPQKKRKKRIVVNDTVFDFVSSNFWLLHHLT